MVQKRPAEALLTSTYNICFHGEIRKILCGYPLLSVAMHYDYGIFENLLEGYWWGQIGWNKLLWHWKLDTSADFIFMIVVVWVCSLYSKVIPFRIYMYLKTYPGWIFGYLDWCKIPVRTLFPYKWAFPQLLSTLSATLHCPLPYLELWEIEWSDVQR